MKKKWYLIYLILFLLPFLLVLLFSNSAKKSPQSPAPEKPAGFSVALYRHQSGKIETLELREYLWGVLAGEMPASYPKEALKAQVVASYSYFLHRLQTISEHPASDFGHPADICDDPAHCKAFLSPAEAAAKWGKDWLKSAEPRLTQAVDAVLGEALLYEERPANTVFHAISGGSTEAAEDVWGAEIPYLIAVDSRWDCEAKGFSSKVAVPLEEFTQKLKQTDCSLGAVALTQGGSVASVTIGGKSFSGRELRQLFQLRSTRFTLEIQEDQAIFQVNGYGHQVGMSQYGASVLAQKNYSYREILSYYYKGCSLATNYYPAFE